MSPAANNMDYPNQYAYNGDKAEELHFMMLEVPHKSLKGLAEEVAARSNRNGPNKRTNSV